VFPFDRDALLAINGLVGSSAALFEGALFLCGSFPLVGCVATLLALWWTDVEGGGGSLRLGGGFGNTSQGTHLSRARCVAIALAVAAAFVLTRLIAFSASFPRPTADGLRVPIDPARFAELMHGMTGFGAFPSDHAALYFALAAGLFAWSRKLGWAGIVVASILSLARVGVGFHYPSDVVAGALIGAVLGKVMIELQRRSPHFFDMAVRLFDDHPSVMYPALFVAAIDFTAHFRLVFGAVFYLVPRILGG
jgi:membrane-associated phospholipid phosphatase